MQKNFRGNNMKEICSICHQETIPIEIHGHIQCNKCGQNYSPCCEGEVVNEQSKQAERTEGGEGSMQTPS